MSDYIKGCGRDDQALTLYRISSTNGLLPLSGGYYHVRCGYRPPSKIQNSILLCEGCIVKLRGAADAALAMIAR